MQNSSSRTARTILLPLIAVASVTASFGMGVKLSGDVETVDSTQAGEVMLGDMDGSMTVDQHDVEILLKIAQENREPTPHQLRADPNQDGKLTVEDAMRILRELNTQ